MNDRQELVDWLAYHAARFPGLDVWLRKLPRQEDTIQAWDVALRCVTLEQAQAASDQMMIEDDAPRRYEAHPAAVLALVRGRGPEPSSSTDDTEECWRCGRSGALVVYLYAPMHDRWVCDAATVELCQALYGDDAETITTARRCNCPNGDKLSNLIPRFEPWQVEHCPRDVPEPEAI